MVNAQLTREDVDARISEIFGAGMRELGIGAKHDATGTPQATGYMHGSGGLLSFPGTDPQVFHTIIGALPGLLNQIPTRASVFMDPTFTVLTGQRADVGDEKTAVCDDAPTPGLLKAGKLWSPFGRYERATPELEIGRLGQLNDRADPVDLRLMGNPIGDSPWGDPASPDFLRNMLVNEVQSAIFRRNVSMHRLLARQVWQGDPANNNGDAYKEMVGLEELVDTGHVDAETNTALPSVDPDVKNFNYQRVDSAGDALVDAITYMVRFVRSKAMRTDVEPVRWAFAMREELFYEVTAVWPCSYLTYRCEFRTSDGTIVQNVSANDQVAMRDAMRNGRYLLVDGVQYDVILDDGITELNGNNSGGNFPAGCFASDIYFLPMSVLGGTSVLFTEFFNFNNEAINQAIGMLGGTTRVRSAGAFLEFVRQTNQCFASQIQINPRIILRTPWLAARLQNVVYCPLQHTAEPFPDDAYWTNGGDTTRSGPSYYARWKS